ncbi:hypothetical protein QTI33_08160 [Variovorax sp. J22P271]|uniref:hypothetical protein n=1 Tax=Variovorax davisae TaxID=3053515 RepID=UPI0025781747|nr:hypothetical protein [Variovorax sp. J22P271]MDM0032110.1 hypothetical protein [Variovorax sp. J22P271]
MSEQYPCLAVFFDNPGEGNFVWIVLESTGYPAVWLDLDTGSDSSAWLEAFEAGNNALLANIDDQSL